MVEISKTELAAKELADRLIQEVDTVKKLVLPSLLDMLEETRRTRMALSGEVSQIIQLYASLRQTLKGIEDLERLTNAINKLKEVHESLPKDFRVKLEDFFHV
jgi:predicted butyrate kinase (DUF1464 family)